MTSFAFVIKNGTITAIYDDAIRDFFKGDIEITRASFVEPTPEGKWIADMSPAIKQFKLECDNPILGPFDLREQALAAERAWLEENVFQYDSGPEYGGENANDKFAGEGDGAAS